MIGFLLFGKYPNTSPRVFPQCTPLQSKPLGRIHQGSECLSRKGAERRCIAHNSPSANSKPWRKASFQFVSGEPPNCLVSCSFPQPERLPSTQGTPIFPEETSLPKETHTGTPGWPPTQKQLDSSQGPKMASGPFPTVTLIYPGFRYQISSEAAPASGCL